MGLHPIQDLIDEGIHPKDVAPVVTLSNEHLVVLSRAAEGRHATGYQQSTHLKEQTLAADGREAHDVGTRGEGALNLYIDDNLNAIDESPSWNGDGGTDLVLRGYEIDAKTTTYGWAAGYEPVLRIEQRHHDDPEHRPDLYYLNEEIHKQKHRLIGFIPADEVEEAAVELDPGDTFRGFTSQTYNYAVPFEELTMVIRDWQPE